MPHPSMSFRTSRTFPETASSGEAPCCLASESQAATHEHRFFGGIVGQRHGGFRLATHRCDCDSHRSPLSDCHRHCAPQSGCTRHGHMKDSRTQQRLYSLSGQQHGEQLWQWQWYRQLQGLLWGHHHGRMATRAAAVCVAGQRRLLLQANAAHHLSQLRQCVFFLNSLSITSIVAGIGVTVTTVNIITITDIIISVVNIIIIDVALSASMSNQCFVPLTGRIRSQ